MSSLIECRKCGQRGTSKCPRCRSIFIDDLENLLSHVLKMWVEDRKLHIVIPVRDDGDALEALLWLTNTLQEMRDGKPGMPTLEQYLCDHDWCWQEGSGSRIDCGCPVPTILSTSPERPLEILS